MARVKICGITNITDANQAVGCGAWALGFIFYKKSPRYIAPSKAKKIIEQLPPFVTPVGVFVNEKRTDIEKIAQTCGLKTIQLHGDESPSFCNRLTSKYTVIKAFHLNEYFNFGTLPKYKVAAYLFDTAHPKLYGGSGKVFDWSLLKKVKDHNTPMILSGGLNPRNVRQAIRSIDSYAVDVSSGVERSPGKKSRTLLKQLFKNMG